MEAWLLHAADPHGICTDVWIRVLLPLLLRLLFPHIWVWRGRTQEVCGRCGTQSALIYFLHLLWFLQQGPEHSWSQAWCWAVRAWNQLCQHSRGFGSVRWVSLAKSILPTFTTTLSCSHNDTSTTTSSILVNVESNMVMLTSLASFCQTLTHLIRAVMWYFAVCFVRMSDEDFHALCCGFLVVSSSFFSFFTVLCCGFLKFSLFFLKIACQVLIT